MTILLAAAFAGLGYRLVDLQVLRHEELRSQALANTQRFFYRESRRGDIRDIKGNLLATSKLVKTVCADPTLICNTNVGNRQLDFARALAPLLQLNEPDLLGLLQNRLITNHQGKVVLDQYVVLKRKVKVEEWETIQNRLKKLEFSVNEKALPAIQRSYFKNLRQRAIFAEDDQLREYPNQTQASHILGYVGRVETQTSHGLVIETTGVDGLELSLNKVLHGIRGWRQTELDERKQELVAYREQDVAPRPGLNAVLTLDLGLQNIVETELAEAMQQHSPISVSAIMVRPATGEILAMATYPTFNPNNPGASLPDHRRNRVITDLSEPGSTFKIVVVAAALNEKIVTLQDVFDCEHGVFYYAGKALHDHESYGLLSVEQIITKSSNIGAAKIGLKLGQERLYQYMTNFGFGSPTGLPLLGERIGTVHPLKKWNKLSITRIPMGHEVAVTPMQMMLAMCAIANGGRLMKPMLVDHLEDEEGRVAAKYQPQMAHQACLPETAKFMVKALKTVVSTNGTARGAHLDNYQVAGKTGTAKKADAKGYLDGKYFSSFIGFFPADRPELCISVVLDEPKMDQGYYGGKVAAPIFKNIAERAAKHLSIRPDIEPVENNTVPKADQLTVTNTH